MKREEERNYQKVEKMKEEMEGKDNEYNVDYKDLIGNSTYSPVWNQEHPIIENQEKLVEVKKRIQSAGMFSREIGLYKKDIKNNWIQDTGAGLDLRIESRGVPILYRDVPISVTIRRVAFCRDFFFVRMV